MKELTIKNKILFTVERSPDGMFVAYNDELKLTGEGKSIADLCEYLEESIRLLFTELWETKDLEVWLKANNIDYELTGEDSEEVKLYIDWGLK